MKRLLIILLNLMVIQCYAQDLDVETLKRRIDSVYANANSYRDRGEVQQMIKGKAGNFDVQTSFETLFIRGRLFRFSYYNKGKATSYYGFQWDSTGHCKGYKFLNHWEESAENFGKYVAGASGVSNGSAHTIPRLLEPEIVGGNHFLKREKELVLSEETLDDHPCYVLMSGEPEDPLLKVWVDKNSYLVRQINSKLFKSTTHYEPEINISISTADQLFFPKKENRVVLWKNIFLEHGLLILGVLIALIVGIDKLLKQQARKKGKSLVSLPISTKRFGKNLPSYLILLLVLVDSLFSFWKHPDSLLVLILSAFIIGLLYLVMQHRLRRKREIRSVPRQA